MNLYKIILLQTPLEKFVVYDNGAIDEKTVYKFNNDKEVKTFTQNFFKSKDKNFYSNNNPLPLKWKIIINNDGELIECN